ncbi:MAG: diaminopimelate decarboxylase [Proteobacteria bacterium]|nr:diaminopimelate decarboxylase [Pseudomonadota bacterium]
MDHFNYHKGWLAAEDVSIKTLAEEIGTPFYCYSTATLVRHYRVFAEGFKEIPTQICYALKANSNIAVIKTLANEGAGADCVSEGEVMRALKAGVDPKKIVFSGVGKSRGEMAFALKKKIGQFNVESREELKMLSEVAASLSVTANIAIRVNPDVDAHTNDKITTGRKTDKFGIGWEEVKETYADAKRYGSLNVVGVSTHIGSQITDLAPFEAAFKRVVGLVEELRTEGYAIKRLDLGGGLGIPYHHTKIPPSPADYARLITTLVKPLQVELIVEPGRVLCGNAGILVSRVILVKRTPHRTFAVIDAGMNDLIRPTLYSAHHDIVPVEEVLNKKVFEKMDVVGPVCETGDVFARDRELPQLKEGDLIAFRSAGAYGAVMAGTYNTRLLVPEVMVNGEKHAVIRARESYKQLLAHDKVPGWLS